MVDPTENPKSWESYFKDIVRLHYSPANCKDVPDSHVGDYGIEIYTLNGHVFQCYLPEQQSDLKKLLDSQKNKINTDIKKFSEKYVDELKKLFGEIKISRWILATPYHKSASLVQFCTQKSIEVREMGVAYVADDFEICVHTEDDYKIEVAALKREAYQHKFNFDRISDVKAEKWISNNYDFLSKLDVKIPKITPSEKILTTKAFLVQKYLEYQNLLEGLKLEWPDLYETVIGLVSHRQSYLESMFITSPTTLPPDIISNELSKLEADILREIKTINPKDVELIKWGVVSDWLIRCPLDF